MKNDNHEGETTMAELKKKTMVELKEIAKTLGIVTMSKDRKAEVIGQIFRRLHLAEVVERRNAV